jgi:hypothetical protein
MNSNRIFAAGFTALLLLVAFVAGQWRTTAAVAQNRPGWEYQVLRADKIERSASGGAEIKELKRFGDDGWEAIAMNDSWVLLKRAR